MNVYTVSEGQELVRAARGAIELYLANPHFDKQLIKDSLRRFDSRLGVFVTIEHYPTETLRGCVGFPSPVSTIKNDLVEAALAAAFEDPRFVPVSKPELEHITIEVSLLSEQTELRDTPEKRKRDIKIGRDGLIARYGVHSGLLLPIVAVQQGWSVQRFLEEVCRKAGLPPTYWTQPNVKLYRFETQIFKEREPSGDVGEVRFR